MDVTLCISENNKLRLFENIMLRRMLGLTGRK
jgi:hypothetical protein